MKPADIRAFFTGLSPQDQEDRKTQRVYSVLAINSESFIDPDIPMCTENSRDDSGFDGLPTDHNRNLALGRLPEFLSHFTLGFADGLTVPFALTAGLSSLGHTNMVVYAGIAEICAGCISMGISGYLAVKGDTTVKSQDHGERLELAGRNSIREYLTPLELPPNLFQYVNAHIDYNPAVSRRLLCYLNSTANGLTSETQRFPPAAVGLSVSVGYMLGGLLPLLPYFFVDEVADGLRWSFAVCILALFIFGFVKVYLLHSGSTESNLQYRGKKENPVAWKRLKRSCVEGMRMVVMGGIAAAAAVLCVKLFDDIML
ncbi:VIT family-domain-containing protein [Daldinia sp. FL1419]|nr:VIT family-domain-containing protein [Daldinia sp. FL1419]